MTDKPRRLQTATERDVQSARARAERAERLAAVPAEVDDSDDLTGRYEGEELQRRRAERSDDKRIGRLETKYDGLSAVVHTMAGQVDSIFKFTGAEAEARAARATAEAAERESRRKYIVPIITAIGVALVGIIAALAGRA